MTTTIAPGKPIVTTGKYFNDLRLAANAGIPVGTGRNSPNASELYRLIDEYNASLPESVEFIDDGIPVVEVDEPDEVIEPEIDEPTDEPAIEVEPTIEPEPLQVDEEPEVLEPVAYVDPLDEIDSIPLVDPKDIASESVVADPVEVIDAPEIAVGAEDESSVAVDPDPVIPVEPEPQIEQAEVIEPIAAPAPEVTAPQPAPAKAKKPPKYSAVAPAERVGQIKPVKAGSKRVEMMRSLIPGITIEDLATQYAITKQNAAGFPSIARRFGYEVKKLDDGTNRYQLILPEGMTDILTTANGQD